MQELVSLFGCRGHIIVRLGVLPPPALGVVCAASFSTETGGDSLTPSSSQFGAVRKQDRKVPFYMCFPPQIGSELPSWSCRKAGAVEEEMHRFLFSGPAQMAP